MTAYVEFYNSDLYHTLKDKNHTTCSITVVTQDEQYQDYAGTEYPLPRVTSTPPSGKKLCSKCAERGK